MKIISEKENFLKNMVRDIIAVDPLASIRRAQELVENNTGHSISDKYLAKIMYKVRREAVVQSDRKKINERLSEVRVRYRMLIKNLNRTIYWKQEYLNEYGLRRPDYKQTHAAIKLVAQLELALFRAELDAGMYEDRRVAIEDMLKQGVLPVGLHEQVITAFRSWKLQPKEG